MRKALTFLSQLEDSDIDWLVANGSRRSFGPGEHLVIAGQQPAALSIVLDGSFAVTAEGKPLHKMQPGELVGEYGLVDQRQATATVTARRLSSALCVPLPQLLAHIEADPSFGMRIYRAIAQFLASRLRETTLHVVSGAVPVLEETLYAPMEPSPLAGGDHISHELDDDELDGTTVAGARFDWILQRLGGR